MIDRHLERCWNEREVTVPPFHDLIECINERLSQLRTENRTILSKLASLVFAEIMQSCFSCSAKVLTSRFVLSSRIVQAAGVGDDISPSLRVKILGISCHTKVSYFKCSASPPLKTTRHDVENFRIPDPHWGDIRAFSEGNGTKNVLKF